MPRAREAIGAPAPAALEEFEPLFFNNPTLALDGYFVHRLRMVTGLDGNPINEVEVISHSEGGTSTASSRQLSRPRRRPSAALQRMFARRLEREARPADQTR